MSSTGKGASGDVNMPPANDMDGVTSKFLGDQYYITDHLGRL